MLRDDRLSWREVLAAVLLLAAAFVGLRSWNTLENSLDGRLARQFGWRPDPEATREFLAELGQEKYFATAAPEAMAKAQQKDTFLYRAMYAAHQASYGRPYETPRQGIGDCVAFGAASGVFCADSIDWQLGRLPSSPLLVATESVYGGSRVEARGKSGDGDSPLGGWSDGSTGSAAARWLRDWGVVYRKKYDTVDLTTYSADRAKSWGAYGNGGQGDKGRLDQVAKKHPCRHVVLVRNWQECVAAIGSGFPVTIASSVGFASGDRDSDGFCAARSTWMHQMVLAGTRFAANAGPETKNPRDGCLVLNSWGRYLGGGKFPPDQPEGSFWATRADIERILAQGDSWAIGSVAGWGWRDLHHGDWLMPPVETLTRSGE